MSQITVLGFTPSSSSSSTSSGVHWAILISPYPPSSATKTQKPKSRFFHAKIAKKEPQTDSMLFDMHNHQLRQQPFPIPLREESTTTDPSSDIASPSGLTSGNQQPTLTALPTSTPMTGPGNESTETITITTLNAESSHPLQLTIKILVSVLAQHPPSKLIPRLSQRLYTTPTYGPEDDWLRNALSAMYEGGRGAALLEPGFDVDKFVDYSGEAAKEYALYEPESNASHPEQEQGQEQEQEQEHHVKEKPVLELDYAAHVARNAEVKALLSHQQQQYHHQSSQYQQQLPTPPQSPTMATTTTTKAKKVRGWLGFRVSPSPGARTRRPVERYSFERQDDPYGGLM